MSVYWFILTLSSKPGKILWILFVFVFFGAFQLVLLYIFGEAPIAVDMFLNLVTTNSGEASELLGNILPAVLGVIIFFGGALVLASISIHQKSKLGIVFRQNQRKYSILLFILSLVGISGASILDSTFRLYIDIYPINVCYNVGLAVDRNIKTKNYFETSKNFKFNSMTTHPQDEPEIYVFIIGETARAMNFGIYGYERNTTPELQKIKSQLFLFPNALTQSNTTHKSVPMLLSAACAENYDCIYKQKSIITAFKEAGYATSFFSNQMYNHSFIDFFGDEADNNVYEKENVPDSANVSDDALLALLENELNKKDKNKKFIVLHTYGSHFDYKERYPAKNAYFKPDSALAVNWKYREQLMNAYDNSIHYTDSFIARVIDLVNQKGVTSAVLYTSDHGEDIFDDNRHLFLHASPSPTAYQLYVPYIVWLSPSYMINYPENGKNLRKNALKPVATNLVTFHTILSLAGISGNEIDSRFSLSNPKFLVTPRRYLNDHNRPMPLNDIGLKKQDEEVMKKYHITYP